MKKILDHYEKLSHYQEQIIRRLEIDIVRLEGKLKELGIDPVTFKLFRLPNAIQSNPPFGCSLMKKEANKKEESDKIQKLAEIDALRSLRFNDLSKGHNALY